LPLAVQRQWPLLEIKQSFHRTQIEITPSCGVVFPRRSAFAPKTVPRESVPHPDRALNCPRIELFPPSLAGAIQSTVTGKGMSNVDQPRKRGQNIHFWGVPFSCAGKKPPTWQFRRLFETQEPISAEVTTFALRKTAPERKYKPRPGFRHCSLGSASIVRNRRDEYPFFSIKITEILVPSGTGTFFPGDKHERPPRTKTDQLRAVFFR